MLLGTALMTWVGGLWAGYSTSLNSHLAARAFQGLGAGAVEALVRTRKHVVPIFRISLLESILFCHLVCQRR